MAEKIARLKQKQIEHARPPKDRRAILLADGGNWYLQASRSNDGSISRSWIFRYQDGFKPDGKPQRHDLGLGPQHTISLADARERARKLRQQLIDGIDPLATKIEARRARLAQRAEQAKAITFAKCAEMYIATHSPSWKNPKHAAQWPASLSAYAYPAIGDLAVADIDTTHLVKFLQPLFSRIP